MTRPPTVNLDNTLYKTGEFERAEEYEQSTSLSSTVFGLNDQETTQVIAGWILSLRALGRDEQTKAVEKDRSQREAKRLVGRVEAKLIATSGYQVGLRQPLRDLVQIGVPPYAGTVMYRCTSDSED